MTLPPGRPLDCERADFVPSTLLPLCAPRFASAHAVPQGALGGGDPRVCVGPTRSAAFKAMSKLIASASVVERRPAAPSCPPGVCGVCPAHSSSPLLSLPFHKLSQSPIGRVRSARDTSPPPCLPTARSRGPPAARRVTVARVLTPPSPTPLPAVVAPLHAGRPLPPPLCTPAFWLCPQLLHRIRAPPISPPASANRAFTSAHVSHRSAV